MLPIVQAIRPEREKPAREQAGAPGTGGEEGDAEDGRERGEDVGGAEGAAGGGGEAVDEVAEQDDAAEARERDPGLAEPPVATLLEGAQRGKEDEERDHVGDAVGREEVVARVPELVPRARGDEEDHHGECDGRCSAEEERRLGSAEGDVNTAGSGVRLQLVR